MDRRADANQGTDSGYCLMAMMARQNPFMAARDLSGTSALPMVRHTGKPAEGHGAQGGREALSSRAGRSNRARGADPDSARSSGVCSPPYRRGHSSRDETCGSRHRIPYRPSQIADLFPGDPGTGHSNSGAATIAR